MAHFMFIRGNRNKRLFHDIGAELERKGHQVHLIQLELNELLMKTTIPTVFYLIMWRKRNTRLVTRS